MCDHIQWTCSRNHLQMLRCDGMFQIHHQCNNNNTYLFKYVIINSSTSHVMVSNMIVSTEMCQAFSLEWSFSMKGYNAWNLWFPSHTKNIFFENLYRLGYFYKNLNSIWFYFHNSLYPPMCCSMLSSYPCQLVGDM